MVTKTFIMGQASCDVCYVQSSTPPFALACEVKWVAIMELSPGRHIRICNGCRCKLLGCDGKGVPVRSLREYIWQHDLAIIGWKW